MLQELIIPALKGENPTSKAVLKNRFKIDYHALNAEVTRNFEPWSEGLHLDILNIEEQEKFKAEIEMLRKDDLIALHRNGVPACNALFLAQKILPCYTESPCSYAEIATELKTQHGWIRATPAYVETFWTERCRPKLGKIARIILEYPTNTGV